jgi:hypothetical protein
MTALSGKNEIQLPHFGAKNQSFGGTCQAESQKNHYIVFDDAGNEGSNDEPGKQNKENARQLNGRFRRRKS